MNGLMALLYFIASIVTVLILLVAIIPVFDAMAGALLGFGAGVTLILKGLILILVVTFLAVIFRRFTKDLNSTTQYN